MNGKRWIALGIFVVVAALFAFGIAGEWTGVGGDGKPVYYYWDEEILRGTGPEKIAVIDIEGVISPTAESDGLFASEGFSPEDVLSKIRQAEEDPDVLAVVLNLETPGGDVVTTDHIYRRLLQLRERADIPVIASMGSVAASGGYYLAMAADSVFAGPNTITGSIGVILSFINYQEAFEKLGLEEVVIKSGALKDMGSPTREMTPEERQVFERIIMEDYQQFVEVVTLGTGLDRQRVLELADGRIFTGLQAQREGLVDEIGYLEDAIDYAAAYVGAEDPLVVRYVYAQPNFLDFLLYNLSLEGFTPPWMSFLDGDRAPRARLPQSARPGSVSGGYGLGEENLRLSELQQLMRQVPRTEYRWLGGMTGGR